MTFWPTWVTQRVLFSNNQTKAPTKQTQSKGKWEKCCPIWGRIYSEHERTTSWNVINYLFLVMDHLLTSTYVSETNRWCILSQVHFIYDSICPSFVHFSAGFLARNCFLLLLFLFLNAHLKDEAFAVILHWGCMECVSIKDHLTG